MAHRREKSYGIPNLEFNLFVRNRDQPGSEFDADGQIMYGLESFVCELKEKTGFADTCISNNDICRKREGAKESEGERGRDE